MSNTSIIKTAISVCKAIMRNGYDAYAINAALQKKIIEEKNIQEVDIACGCDLKTLQKIFPHVQVGENQGAMATLEENDVLIYMYPAEVEDAAHPERALLRITPRMLKHLDGMVGYGRFSSLHHHHESHEGFEDRATGQIKFEGLPSLTLSSNYLLAIRALRYAANFDLPIEPATWVAIVQTNSRILDYVPAREIMEEWRLVSAESMWKFVKLLYDAHILHGLVPELAALDCIQQHRNDDSDELETVFDHTIACMMHYPADELSMDWYGVMATLFHDVGKLYTAEQYNGRWTFYQHHRVGAAVTRKILRRLHFTPEDIDLICHLVRHHMTFHFMLTDRGLRRFKALTETNRLMEICRADIKARNGSYTYFNHNCKYLERTETDEIMLEPLLNGNEIMEYTNLPPGPDVGRLREALLAAQVAGEVKDRDGAVAFVKTSIK